MLFALGIVAGISLCTFAAVILSYFRKPIERTLEIVERRIELAGPRPRGFVLEPLSEADEVRQTIIERNAERGAATPISELM